MVQEVVCFIEKNRTHNIKLKINGRTNNVVSFQKSFALINLEITFINSKCCLKIYCDDLVIKK